MLRCRFGQFQGQEGEKEGEETKSKVEEGRAEGAREIFGYGLDDGDEGKVGTISAGGDRV